MRKSFWIVALLGFVLLLGIGYEHERTFQLMHKAAAQPETGVTVGRTIPSFTASTLDGQSVQIGFPGRPTVLNFWASWCPPCREELPDLSQFAKNHTADIQFYAINLQESGDKVSDFLYRNGYTLPVLLDTGGNIGQTFRIYAIPTTIVVDSQGVIRFRKTGGVTVDELENVLNSL